MKTHRPACAIVDGYSTGRILPLIFTELGFDCLHIESNPRPLPFKAFFQPERYSAGNVTFDGDLSSLSDQLATKGIQAVLPGCETGVQLADALAERMRLVTNGTALSHARRDKYLMTKALAQHGLKKLDCYMASTWSELKTWIQQGATFPLVLKPIDSAGTDCVRLCTNEQEAKRAFEEIAGAEKKVGGMNEYVLAERFLSGDEYVVNTVSSDGQHCITDMWLYHKKSVNSSSFVYDAIELLPAPGKQQLELADYTRRSLDALGIRHGAAHSEVMLTPDGPVLIEVGARLCGTNMPMLARECTNMNPLLLTALAYVDKEQFLEKAHVSYDLVHYALITMLISTAKGTVRSIPTKLDLPNLPTLSDLHFEVDMGSTILPTTDLFSSPGHIELIADVPGLLWRDHQRIRATERDGGFFG